MVYSLPVHEQRALLRIPVWMQESVVHTESKYGLHEKITYPHAEMAPQCYTSLSYTYAPINMRTRPYVCNERAEL